MAFWGFWTSPSQLSQARAGNQQPAPKKSSGSMEEKGDYESLTEAVDEHNEKVALCEYPANSRNAFLQLPTNIRRLIYDRVLVVGDGYLDFLSRGIICLADGVDYPPKLCNLACFRMGQSQYSEHYLTEDCEFFKSFIHQKAEAWRMEINQLKYVCKQLHSETRGITLKINTGKKIMFHGTKASNKLARANTISRYAGRDSGVANFLHFYRNCSPTQRTYIRDVDIIQLPLDDEQPRRNEQLTYPGPAARSPTWVEQFKAFVLPEALQPRPSTDIEIERRAFRRRCAEMTGRGGTAWKHLYEICQQNPSIRVIVRYNEWQGTGGREWFKRMCTYHLALRNDVRGVTLSEQEKERVCELLMMNCGASISPSLDNLRMSSSANFSLAGTHPSWYFMDDRPVKSAAACERQRVEECGRLFEEGV